MINPQAVGTRGYFPSNTEATSLSIATRGYLVPFTVEIPVVEVKQQFVTVIGELPKSKQLEERREEEEILEVIKLFMKIWH